ncbi:MAG: hypothetical protein IKX58_07420, partial [Clostridia bacterium]|nr:hypothetical protein [Clostridia bacterium]
MNAPFAKISPFHVDPEKIMETFGIQDDDFSKATSEEKESMVETHKSISYWKDAWRRFRANTVSMIALFVFIACLLFAFVGPYLIPYNYSDQYRTAQKLGPFEYSPGEQAALQIQKQVDGFFSTASIPGTLTALEKGDYVAKLGKKTYAFTLEQPVDNCAI